MDIRLSNLTLTLDDAQALTLAREILALGASETVPAPAVVVGGAGGDTAAANTAENSSVEGVPSAEPYFVPYVAPPEPPVSTEPAAPVADTGLWSPADSPIPAGYTPAVHETVAALPNAVETPAAPTSN